MADFNYERFEEVDKEFEASANAAPWADIPRNNNLPNQLYHFKCIDVYCGSTLEHVDENGVVTGGKGKVVAVLGIVAPADFAGRIHTENFTIGTDTDKKAKDQRLWLKNSGFGATNLVNLLDHVGGKAWPDLLNKEFLAFTVVNNNYTNINYKAGFFQKGQLAPGTPSPAQRGRLRDSSTVASQPHFAPQLSDPECTRCLQKFPASEIIEHIRHCKGPQKQTDVADEIPF